jgi:hypothetical protein
MLIGDCAMPASSRRVSSDVQIRIMVPELAVDLLLIVIVKLTPSTTLAVC